MQNHNRMYYLLVIFGVFIASLSQLLLKKSSKSDHSSFIMEYLNPNVIISYTIMVFVLLCDIYAMNHGVKATQLSSLESLSYFFVPVLSYFFFKEKLSIRRLFAIGIIILGVVVFFQ